MPCSIENLVSPTAFLTPSLSMSLLETYYREYGLTRGKPSFQG